MGYSEINILLSLTSFLFLLRNRRLSVTTRKLRFKVSEIKTLTIQLLISLCDFQGSAINFKITIMNQNSAITKTLHRIHGVGYEHNRLFFTTQFSEICITFTLKSLISNCQNFI